MRSNNRLEGKQIRLFCKAIQANLVSNLGEIGLR